MFNKIYTKKKKRASKTFVCMSNVQWVKHLKMRLDLTQLTCVFSSLWDPLAHKLFFSKTQHLSTFTCCSYCL